MLVTVDDLAAYMDIGFSAKAKVGVTAILNGLQSSIEAYLGRPVEVRTFTENLYVRPEYYGSVFTGLSGDFIGPAPALSVPLRNSPIVSITSVYFSTVGSASVVPVLQFENQDYVARPYGIDVLNGLGTYETVTVTYVAGLDGANDPKYSVFKHLILRAASREAQNLHDDNRGIQNHEAREAAPALPTGFTEEEFAEIRRYRRQRI